MMASTQKFIRSPASKNLYIRLYAQRKSQSPGASQQQPSKPDITADVPGFSSKVVDIPKEPVGGPGAAKNKEYKNPEYFCYHVDSFGESFVELAKYRLEAPSNKVKFDRNL